MLSITAYVAAIEIRISSGIIKGHDNSWQPGVFGCDVNLGDAWCNQKDWRCANFPDFLGALSIGLDRITRKRACADFCRRIREHTFIRRGLARRHSIRPGNVAIAGRAKVARETFVSVAAPKIL